MRPALSHTSRRACVTQRVTVMLQALWACNLALATLLELRGTVSTREEARLLRADVQESKAIERALQVS